MKLNAEMLICYTKFDMGTFIMCIIYSQDVATVFALLDHSLLSEIHRRRKRCVGGGWEGQAPPLII